MANDSFLGGVSRKIKNVLRATFVELYETETPYAESDKYYLNGSDNLYPLSIERVIQNSPTAKRAALAMKKYISGSGLTNFELNIVNKKQNKSLYDVVKEIAHDISYQNGVFLHRSIKIDTSTGEPIFITDQLTVLDYVKCRVSKKDDGGSMGKIFYKDFNPNHKTKKQGGKKEEAKWYYSFSNNQDVIQAQIQADSKELIENSEQEPTIEELTKNYRGQVYYLNLDPRLNYALSKFDAVYNDCDTEFRMSTYSNKMTREGFLGKTAILVNNLDEETSLTIKEDVKNWLGTENSSGVYFLEVEETENLDNVLKIINVETQYDDEMFTNTEKRVRRNILGAANNIPEPLLYSNDGSALFGNSGEAYNQMKVFYEEQNNEERKAIEKMLLMFGFDTRIKLITHIDSEIKDGQNDIENLSNEDIAIQEQIKSQATLRGSVGGVQGILQIQQSVSQELTDIDSAIEILVEIYGFERATASKILGKPEIENKNE